MILRTKYTFVLTCKYFKNQSYNNHATKISWLTGPMGPFHDFFVQFVSWTLRGLQLSSSEKLIIFGDVSQTNSFLDQVFASFQLLPWRLNRLKRANKCNSQAFGVVAIRVRSFFSPTPSFVSISVTTNQKIVPYVRPIPALYVEHLYRTDIENALSLERAIFGCSVLYYDIGNRIDRNRIHSWKRWLRHPFYSRYDPQLIRKCNVCRWI